MRIELNYYANEVSIVGKELLVMGPHLTIYEIAKALFNNAKPDTIKETNSKDSKDKDVRFITFETKSPLSKIIKIL